MVVVDRSWGKKSEFWRGDFGGLAGRILVWISSQHGLPGSQAKPIELNLNFQARAKPGAE